ncbi:MAG: glycosyltransferase [Cyanobacteria bacterium P01_E01_bin.45]
MLDNRNWVVIVTQTIVNAWKVLKEEGVHNFWIRTKNKIRKILGKNLQSEFVSEIINLSKLESYNSLTFKHVNNPHVSILIPVYNQSLYTYNCLRSLHQRTGSGISFEIIIIDDLSTDNTVEVLQAISGITVLRNSENLGFIRSCNRGLEAARADLVCYLNNDTQILPNWLESLVDALESQITAAAVGSKLIYPDGRLQEAGGIIWQDASGCNYGRLDSPLEPQYNYVRPVDYCSAASLLVRTQLMRDLGGFSEEFLPAYYEDTDACFQLRERGYDILYQPQSQVIHYEGISSGTDESTGAKRHQVTNRTTFQNKWQQVLNQHYRDSANALAGSRRLCQQPIILIVDSYVPVYDRESGSCRLFQILKLMLDLGYTPIFLPDNGLPEEPYTSQLQQMGIEVLYPTPQQPDLLLQLRDRLPLLDLAWVCRPQLCEKYLPVLQTRNDLPTIYDTIDLHFVRMQRQESYQPASDTEPSWQEMKALELAIAQKTDATVVVTDPERTLLEELGISRVRTIPNVHIPYGGQLPRFEQRQGLLFIGGYNHVPNVDAVVWFCQEIAPIIWQRHPEIAVTLLGSNPPEAVQQLAGDRVTVTGYIADVEEYFLRAKVFVAPLRYGAGMKGKIGHSLSYGLPVVTTGIGAEGMGLVDGRDVIVREQPDAFANAVLEMYGDAELWERLSAQSLRAIEQFGPGSLRGHLQGLLNELLPTKLAADTSLRAVGRETD